APVVDLTYVFYAAEEIAAEHSGLLELYRERPDLLDGDAAVLGEPTDGWLEAGCQGTARVRLTFRGARAHTARPWMGRNAIHRLGGALVRIAGYEARSPVIDGCEYREAMQAVFVDGGIAGNVVPDEATLTVNLRIAPDRTVDDALGELRAILDGVIEESDGFDVVDRASPAPPSLTHPLIARLADDGAPVRAKLGWTDVARFAEHGMPAVNFGPGEATVAHTADERVERSSIDRVHRALRLLLTT
ncbi:MAG: M20/M25/M40 family metallo-hydrolase, partial [Acidimicrobiales bacterium]|nr:M20/M25/M40 family metallo-hydrolase [Acidimicrobiales bacterium]